MSQSHETIHFEDTQFSASTWITEPSQWRNNRLATCLRISTGNASIAISLSESNAKVLMAALEKHIENIKHTEKQIIAIEQIKQKESAA